MSERIRMSSESLNCYGTWIRTSGLQLDQFKRNPVMLWMHTRGLIIGFVKDVKREGEELTGVPVFDEVTEESRRAKAQWDKGSLRMGSPCIEVLETSDDPKLRKPGQTAPTITKAKLLEFSLVDIGGNDDNIRLMWDGEEVKKENAGSKLLLAKNNNDKQNVMNESKIQAIALMLGKGAECSLEELKKEIKSLLLAKTECENLRAQVATLNADIKAMKSAGIVALVDEAVSAGKIDAEKKAHFVALGEQVGAESLKLTLEAMRSAVKPTAVLNRGGEARVVKKWSDATEAELKLLREENPEEYKRLYKEEFGIDCVIA